MDQVAQRVSQFVGDGKEAVTFLIRVKDCIENPARMLVGA